MIALDGITYLVIEEYGTNDTKVTSHNKMKIKVHMYNLLFLLNNRQNINGINTHLDNVEILALNQLYLKLYH